MMIPWKFSLSEKQRWHLVNYIRELGKKQNKQGDLLWKPVDIQKMSYGE
jgi:hypothetical protein